MRLTWVEQLPFARLCMKLLVLSSLSLPVRWILVLSHSADGDTEASRGDAVYPKTIKLGGSKVGPRIQVCTTSKPVFVTTGL